MNVDEDRDKYPQRYAMCDGGSRYTEETETAVHPTDAESYLNEWHNKGYTGNYVPEALRDELPEDWHDQWDDEPPFENNFTIVLDAEGNEAPDNDGWTCPEDDWEEERVTHPLTGGQKGRKNCEPAFVDPVALEALGRVAGKGTRKYDKYNYLRGYDWSLSANALQRHFLAFWSGEDYDQESGELHMAHAAWHALALVSFLARGLGDDDRPRLSS